jgi:hypothetical protein
MKQRKQFRITLDFTIMVDDKDLLTSSCPEEEVYNDRQQLLLQAVVHSPEILEKWHRHLLAGNLECMGWKEWHSLLGDDPEGETDTILLPAIAQLSGDDQEWFAEAVQEDVLVECTEEFHDCFTVTLDENTVKIEEVGA